VAADKVKVHTDRIANLLKSEEKKKHVEEAKVSPEKPVVKPATEERKATLSVNANVSDAKVLVDGRKIGRTPISDVTVSPGELNITVEKQGYEPYRKRILLGKGRSISLYVDLREAGPRKGRLYVKTEPDDANVKILTKQKLAHPKAENRSILTKGWDIFNEPLSDGEVKWQIIGNKTFEVSFQLKSARPNHTYTVGAHFFNPDNLRENFTVNGFIGYTLGNKAGMVVREGNSAYVFSYDFGRLVTDSQGNGSARFIGNIPPGKYALQYTVRIGECFPSKGITSGCGAVFRSGKRFAENLVTINTQSQVKILNKQELAHHISGKWKINFNGHLGFMEISGGSGHYSGRLNFGSWEEMLDLTIKGNRILFRRARADQRYQGTIDGSSMKGTFSQYGGSGEYPWTAELKR